MAVPPLLPPELLAGVIAERETIPDRLRKEGILKVERRWVAPDLPDLELLEACAYGWGFIDSVLTDAEATYLGGTADPRPQEVRWPDCMAVGQDRRSANLHLESGEVIEHETKHHRPTEADFARVEARYGFAINELPRPDDKSLESGKLVSRHGSHPSREGWSPSFNCISLQERTSDPHHRDGPRGSAG
jgi:hypothetical protein